MRVDLPGLVIEEHRNGAPRIRVRVKGDKARRRRRSSTASPASTGA